MIATITEEWTFTTAQTNLSIKSIGATDRGKIYGAVATCSNSNTGDVSLRIGFAASTLPTVTNNSATGNVGVPISHPGIARGGGFVWSGGGGEPIAVGAAGEDMILTCSAATGGSLVVVITHWVESLLE